LRIDERKNKKGECGFGMELLNRKRNKGNDYGEELILRYNLFE
jgi:hypothetical protein